MSTQLRTPSDSTGVAILIFKPAFLLFQPPRGRHLLSDPFHALLSPMRSVPDAHSSLTQPVERRGQPFSRTVSTAARVIYRCFYPRTPRTAFYAQRSRAFHRNSSPRVLGRERARERGRPGIKDVPSIRLRDRIGVRSAQVARDRDHARKGDTVTSPPTIPALSGPERGVYKRRDRMIAGKKERGWGREGGGGRIEIRIPLEELCGFAMLIYRKTEAILLGLDCKKGEAGIPFGCLVSQSILDSCS